MLEALHLTKVYKTKGGADVKALDDVSIQFPEKGMVFLLGKSGSGKSTLLNVCGGLDAPTSGAIMVKGKSSEKFSQSDFDSYRNTYVGFIFQEYNILNEFSVEDNIALALELQGKPKDKKAIADLLEQVDLVGYAKRKPNTLSGGQKQRIAIARALVKSPEIIMADEPTGALDSATGKQVFDTLKKLSKEKLVIVVSHDRDFAELYGDRIVELQDGKIISDVTKTQEQQQALTQNISIVGETLCVKNGADLSEKDFEEIKAFLSKTDKDVIIARGERDVKTFKTVSHIKDNGEKEVFRNSEELPMEVKEYSPKDSKFIRSKLPLKHAIRIGVSGMKTKPIRLIFTILLCTAAFTFFGLLSTMTFYDSEATFKESVAGTDYDYIKVGKNYRVKEFWHYDDMTQDWEYTMNTRFTEEELLAFMEQFGKEAFGAVDSWGNFNVQNDAIAYWVSSVRNFAYLPEDNVLRGKITGRYPENANEICISSYSAEMLFNCKTYDQSTGKLIELTKPEDILNKTISLNGASYKVVGILDSGKLPEKYEVLKESNGTDYLLSSGFQLELQDGLHLVVFVTKERMVQLGEESGMYYGMDGYSNQRVVATAGLNTGSAYIFPEGANAGYGAFSKMLTHEQVTWLVSDKTAPAKEEVVVSKQLFLELITELYTKEQNIAAEIGNQERKELAKKITDLAMQILTNELSEAEAVSNWAELLELLENEEKSLTLAIRLYDDWDGKTIGETKEYKIVGIWEAANSDNRIFFADEESQTLWETQKENMNYYSEYETNFVEPENVVYGTIFLPYDHSKEQTNMLWDIYSNKTYDTNDCKAVLGSALINNLASVDSLILEFSKIFLYAGIVLAVFAALLLSNFISISISYKKQEIGILRAVGARSLDVFKIFFSESFVITAICVVVSTIASLVCCAVINEMLISMISASLFVFGITSFLVLILVALITVVVATFLPVWHAAKKKPVESIRAL